MVGRKESEKAHQKTRDKYNKHKDIGFAAIEIGRWASSGLDPHMAPDWAIRACKTFYENSMLDIVPIMQKRSGGRANQRDVDALVSIAREAYWKPEFKQRNIVRDAFRPDEPCEADFRRIAKLYEKHKGELECHIVRQLTKERGWKDLSLHKTWIRSDGGVP